MWFLLFLKKCCINTTYDVFQEEYLFGEIILNLQETKKMSNKGWGITTEKTVHPLNVVLFVSRKKDNKKLEHFQERRMAFLTHEPIFSTKLSVQFDDFVSKGLQGETSRMYYSVNSRNEQKVHKELLHFLIDNPTFNLCALSAKTAGIAMHHSNAETKRWLFDFDIGEPEQLKEFVEDVHNCDCSCVTTTYVTPHGFAVVVDHGFDTRILLKKWSGYVTLKRDDLLCYKWKINLMEE